MTKPRRIFYHYVELEETAAGMWKRVAGDERKRHMENAADLMRSPAEFGDAMREALLKWPKSCEAAFTAPTINHIAFLGHAGCCVGVGSPEECTRAGWHTLSQTEQDAANHIAAVVLSEWRSAAGAEQKDMFDA